MDPDKPKPPKKFNIIFFSFAIPFFILWIYLDSVTELHSLWWLVGKYICLFLIFIVLIIYRIARKEHSIVGGIAWGCVMLLNLWVLARGDIKKHQNNICQDKFGPEFNTRRRIIGIPLIPKGWSNKSSYGREDALWNGKDSVNCHKAKRIFFDKGCILDFETDWYILKPIRGQARRIVIETDFARGTRKDSVSYNYSIGYSGGTITRQQADSIFAAEKIQKDY